MAGAQRPRIRTAERRFRYLKCGVGGVTGSGKTRGSLMVAYGITGDWSKICVIDSENGSSHLYAHLGPFEVLDLDRFSPRDYVDAIGEVLSHPKKFQVCIIDGISHEWLGRGGANEMVDRFAQSGTNKNKFSAWSRVTPEHNAFIDAMLKAPIHLIATMRKKDDYVLEEDENGKKVPRRVGLKNIQRDNVDYEFDLLLTIHSDHHCTTEKDRTELFDKQPPFMLTPEVGTMLKEWSHARFIHDRNSQTPAGSNTPVNGTPTLPATANGSGASGDVPTGRGETSPSPDGLSASLAANQQAQEFGKQVAREALIMEMYEGIEKMLADPQEDKDVKESLQILKGRKLRVEDREQLRVAIQRMRRGERGLMDSILLTRTEVRS